MRSNGGDMEKTEKKLKILIADDEPLTKMDLKEMLIEAGYEVTGDVADGFDAVEACRRERPDLALLDIRMPYLDGLSAAKIIFDEDLADAIVLLTAYTDMEFVNQAKECGVGGYLVKPIDEKSLVPSIELAVSRSRDLRALKKEKGGRQDAGTAGKPCSRRESKGPDHAQGRQERAGGLRISAKYQSGKASVDAEGG